MEQILSLEALEKMVQKIQLLQLHSCTVNKSVAFTATSENNSKHDGFEIASSSEGNGGAKKDNSRSGGNMGGRPMLSTTSDYQVSKMHFMATKMH